MKQYDEMNEKARKVIEFILEQDRMKILDFTNANIGFLESRDNEVVTGLGEFIGGEDKWGINPKGIAEMILEKETGITQNNYDIVTSVGGAREAIKMTIEAIVTKDRPFVVYASPNWVFDVITTDAGAIGVSFHATTGEEFLRGIEDMPNKENVAGIIMVDPSNPLGYRHTKREIERIEELSETHGFVPIFDDVFRGLQEGGKRKSSSEYSKRGIIIETTTKRFGPLSGGFTWSLIPKKMKIDINDKTQNKDKIRRAARINQYLYEQGYGEKISESIEKNAKELMRGYGDSFGDERTTGFGRFFQSFPSMPIMIYHTNDERFLSSEFVNGIKDMIGVTGGTEWVCNLIYKLEEIVRGNVQFMDEIKKGELYIRICPTKESAEDSYKGGFIFGRSVQEYLNDHPHKIK